MKVLTKLLVIVTSLSAPIFGVKADSPNWSLADTESGWNHTSLVQAYFHNSELQRQWAWELLGKYRFNGSEKVLDFGSGDGKISAEIAHIVPNGFVDGVDLSQEMIRFSRLKFPSEVYSNLRFYRSNSFDLRDYATDKKYDLITAFCVFHFVTEYQSLLQNLRSHLNPNGTLLAVIPAGRAPALFKAAEETFEKYNLPCPWNNANQGKNGAPTMRTLDGCRRIMEDAGFTISQLEIVDKYTPFVSEQELVQWMVGTTTANWNIPQKIVPAFFQEVVARMRVLDPEMVDEEGRWKFKMSRIHLVAVPKS